MSNKPKINQRSCLTWRNWHKSISVGGATSNILQPTNVYDSGQPPSVQEFIPGLRGLQTIIQKAKKKKKKVRAFGSRWSLNDIAYTNQYLVDSTELNYLKIGLPKEQLTDSYKDKNDLLVFTQCGLFVRDLNDGLDAAGLSLPTSGASDGQRIVGAIATGTHGSAHLVGAMTEYVRGIHMVLHGKYVLIQRASDRVANDDFGTWLDNTEIVNDDELFNAALVNFGGFGLIHGLVLEVERRYYLERFINNYDVSQVRKAITDWDLSGLNLPQGDKMPFHFECAINPYNVKDGERGAYVRIYYKHEEKDDLAAMDTPRSDTLDVHTSMGVHITKEVLELATQQIEDTELSDGESSKAKLMGVLVDIALAVSFPIAPPTHPIRVPGKWFTGDHSTDPKTKAPIPGTSIELGVPFDRIGDAMDLVVNTLQQHPFAAPLAFRYVKKSTATLGFTGLGDITVTMEMPGPWGKVLFPETGEAHQALYKALAASNVPHSFHWGQQFPKNSSWVTKTYGAQAVSDWKAQRAKLLDKDGMKMFDNELMHEIGLAEGFSPSKPNLICRTMAFIKYLMGKEG